MEIITKKTKSSTYNLYIAVVTLLFIMIFVDIIGKDSGITKLFPKQGSRMEWLAIYLAAIGILYLEQYIGILIWIILFVVALKNENENFFNDRSRPQPFLNIGNDMSKTKVIDNLMKNIKMQNPDFEVDDNYVNYLYDKYFNDKVLVEKLLQDEKNKMVSDLKSGFVLSYNIEEDEKLKVDRTRWHKLEDL